ncbi:MAG: FAD-dependent oxidoreductase [Candidatus Hydrogenedentota bacterium]
MRPSLRIINGVVLVLACLSIGVAGAQDSPSRSYDIVVYGDSSAAVSAAVAAKRDGRDVVLVNPTRFQGGMSASGLGATDFGSAKLEIVSGIAGEFYRGIAEHYGKGFIRSFEPHVGQSVFRKLVSDVELEVHYGEFLDRENGVEMIDGRIVSITTLSGKTYRATMFIDASYVGDLMATAGVSYTVGRESEAQYGESLAGVRRGDASPRVHYTQKDKDHFIVTWIPMWSRAIRRVVCYPGFTISRW